MYTVCKLNIVLFTTYVLNSLMEVNIVPSFTENESTVYSVNKSLTACKLHGWDSSPRLVHITRADTSNHDFFKIKVNNLHFFEIYITKIALLTVLVPAENHLG